MGEFCPISARKSPSHGPTSKDKAIGEKASKMVFDSTEIA
jgi:hypothetical protein